MDAILDPIRDAVEGSIDFKGQQLATKLNYILMSLVGVFAFIAGIVTQNVFNSIYVGLGGCVLVMLVIVPPWPFFKRDPVKWLPKRKVNGYWVDVPFNKGD